MRTITMAIFLFLLFGCKNFETKKISSEEILDQKLEHFSWNEVDVFPTFKNCQNLIEKNAAKRCFKTTLAKSIYASLSQKPIVVGDSIRESVNLYLLISKKGVPTIDSIAISESLRQQLPKLESSLTASIDSLPKIYPATKRGIPVAVKFVLPIRVVSQ